MVNFASSSAVLAAVTLLLPRSSVVVVEGGGFYACFDCDYDLGENNPCVLFDYEDRFVRTAKVDGTTSFSFFDIGFRNRALEGQEEGRRALISEPIEDDFRGICLDKALAGEETRITCAVKGVPIEEEEEECPEGQICEPVQICGVSRKLSEEDVSPEDQHRELPPSSEPYLSIAMFIGTGYYSGGPVCVQENDNGFPDTETCSYIGFPPYIEGDGIQPRLPVSLAIDYLSCGQAVYVEIECKLDEEKKPSSGGGSSGLCFSKDTTVDVLKKGLTPMDALTIGDQVRVGENQYEPVYGFAHREEKTMATFIQVYVEGHEDDASPPLEMTEDHMLFVNQDYIPAREVQVGDSLSNGVVTKLTTVEKMGLYGPLTPSGTVIVNGIEASTYISLQKDDTTKEGGHYMGVSYHSFIHIALSPVRMMCMGGISSSLCDIDHIDPDTGFPPFVTKWNQLTHVVESLSSFMILQSILVAILAVLFVSVIMPLYLMELVVGPTFTPLVLFGLSTTMAVAIKYVKNQKANKKTVV
jgi:hypothetical protein